MLSASQLKKLNQEYSSVYDNLLGDELVKAFISRLRSFLDNICEQEKCLYNPGHYLTKTAKVGFSWADVYKGYVPNDHIDELTPHIESYLVKYFNLKDFTGFTLNFRDFPNHYLTVIQLVWDKKSAPPVEVAKQKSRTHRSRSRSEEKTLKLAQEITKEVVKAQAELQKTAHAELKKDVKNQIKKTLAVTPPTPIMPVSSIMVPKTSTDHKEMEEMRKEVLELKKQLLTLSNDGSVKLVSEPTAPSLPPGFKPAEIGVQ